MARKEDWERIITPEVEKRVFSYLMKLTHNNREDAEELVSETLLRAWRKWETYRQECPVLAWLYRIALNMARDRWRSEARKRPAASLDAPEQDWHNLFPDTLVAIEDQVCQRETLAQIEQATRCLPFRQREVFRLYFLEGCNFPEIGERLGVGRGSVHRYLYRAVEEVRAQLRHEAQDW